MTQALTTRSTAIGMLSDIETELDSEDSLYGNLDSDDSVSSREECDDEPENDVSDENEVTLGDSSDESSDEEPENTTATSTEGEREG